MAAFCVVSGFFAAILSGLCTGFIIMAISYTLLYVGTDKASRGSNELASSINDSIFLIISLDMISSLFMYLIRTL